MVADDTSVQSNNTTAVTLVDTLHVSINRFIQWTNLNHVALNSSKTKCMYVSTRQKRIKMCSPCPPLFIEDQMIEQVIPHNVLRATIDNDMPWSEHITLLGKHNYISETYSN